uniref:Uncharacterized protein n=1 Tax=Sphaerodactylus townsendi TaxID=933632 RepID=A0ACB8EPI0_9SAUR
MGCSHSGAARTSVCEQPRGYTGIIYAGVQPLRGPTRNGPWCSPINEGGTDGQMLELMNGSRALLPYAWQMEGGLRVEMGMGGSKVTCTMVDLGITGNSIEKPKEFTTIPRATLHHFQVFPGSDLRVRMPPPSHCLSDR